MTDAPQPEPNENDPPTLPSVSSVLAALEESFGGSYLLQPWIQDVQATLIGHLRKLDRRGQQVVLAIASGESRRSAAVRIGITYSLLAAECSRPGPLSEAVAFASELQTGTFENELSRRALAGDSDRGSMRALELILKRQDPAYRDQGSLEIRAVTEAAKAVGDVQSRWVDVTPQTPNTP